MSGSTDGCPYDRADGSGLGDFLTRFHFVCILRAFREVLFIQRHVDTLGIDYRLVAGAGRQGDGQDGEWKSFVHLVFHAV